MAKTGYIIYNGIKQVFTTGTSIGQVVDASFSQTFGTATNILAGGVIFEKKVLDYTRCALDCNVPTLTLPKISFNNASVTLRVGNTVGTTTVQMSTFEDFRNVSETVDTTTTIATLNIAEYTATDTFYFRAYNTCSPNNTSGFTPIVSASKAVVPVSTPTIKLYLDSSNELTGVFNFRFTINMPDGGSLRLNTANVYRATDGATTGTALLTTTDQNGLTYSVKPNIVTSNVLLTVPDTGLTLYMKYTAVPNGFFENSVSMDVLFKDSTNTIDYGVWDIYANALISCFVEGTLITLNDGSQVPIETLYNGQSLLSSNIETLENLNDVPELHKWSSNNIIETRTSSPIVKIEEKEASKTIIINNGLLETTPFHNQLFKRDGIWRFNHMETLQVGDYLYDIDQNEIEVTSVEVSNETKKVYPLSLSPTHTYFANNILTHNLKAPIKGDPVQQL